MGTLTIDKKKFVVIEQKEFDKLQLLAAQKTPPAKKLSLTAGKKLAYKLIDKWAKGKSLTGMLKNNQAKFLPSIQHKKLLGKHPCV